MVKYRKNCIKCPNNIRNKNEKPNTKHVYENTTVIKTERTLINGKSECGKTFLMLSLLNDKNPYDLYTICKTDSRYPSNYLNPSSEILPLEDYAEKLSSLMIC